LLIVPPEIPAVEIVPALVVVVPDEIVTESPLSPIVVVVPFLGLILFDFISLISFEIYI